MTADLSSVLGLVAKATAAKAHLPPIPDAPEIMPKEHQLLWAIELEAAEACYQYLRAHAAELSAMQKDAERWKHACKFNYPGQLQDGRWLAFYSDSLGQTHFCIGATPTEAIDAAIRSERGEAKDNPNE